MGALETNERTKHQQVDIVDAYDGRPGIILANVARREGGLPPDLLLR